MLGVATLLCVMTLSLLVSRVATVALRTTGLSQDAARFQARSALTGVGFTTLESEDILNHPARRRIVLTLMALSGAGVITTLASLLLSFAGTSGVRQPAARLGALVLGLFILWRLALSPHGIPISGLRGGEPATRALRMEEFGTTAATWCCQ